MLLPYLLHGGCWSLLKEVLCCATENPSASTNTWMQSKENLHLTVLTFGGIFRMQMLSCVWNCVLPGRYRKSNTCQMLLTLHWRSCRDFFVKERAQRFRKVLVWCQNVNICRSIIIFTDQRIELSTVRGSRGTAGSLGIFKSTYTVLIDDTSYLTCSVLSDM